MTQTHQVKDKCQTFRYMWNIKTLFLSGNGYFTKCDLKCNNGKEIVLWKKIHHTPKFVHYSEIGAHREFVVSTTYIRNEDTGSAM